MKTLKLLTLALVALCLVAPPAFAEVAKNKKEPGASDTIETLAPNSSVFSGAAVAAGIGAALCIIGAGIGFGRIGSSALESMARQPEVAGQVQTAMIVIAALLEGATFFALVICILLVGKATF